MWILIYLTIFIIVYVKSFKENFTSETIEKVTPVLFAVTAVILLLSILSSILK